MMKKYCVLAAALFSLSLAACSEGSLAPEEKPSETAASVQPSDQSGQNDAAQPETAPAAEPYSGFQKGTVLYEEDGLTITLASFEDDGSFLNINLGIDNNTDHTVRVNVKNGYFDGVWAERTNAQVGDPAPGEKTVKFVTFSKRFFEYYIDGEPDTIELDLDIWDLDNRGPAVECKAVLESSESSGKKKPADSLTLLTEMNVPEPVRLYQSHIIHWKLPICCAPSGLSANALARLSMPQAMQSVFVHPSCMGVNPGDWTFVFYIDMTDMTEEGHRFSVTDCQINGEPAECPGYTTVSHPGYGTYLLIGFPENTTPDDIQTFSFRFQCDDTESEEISWIF